MKITTFRGKYFFLSNFYPQPITWRNFHWTTSEHAYQACKCVTAREANLILRAYSPAEAKRIGKQVTLRTDWDEKKLSFMREILQVKFNIPELRDKLIQTGDAIIEENNWWNDTYWGICNRQGQNKLGKILMKIRNEVALCRSAQPSK